MKRSRSQDVFDEERLSSSDDSGENLMEGMEGDYAAIPELDHYDHSFLDRRDYDRIDIIARRAAETEIDARHLDSKGRLSDQLDDFGKEDETVRTKRRRDILNIDDQDLKEYTLETPGGINLETMDMPLREWIAQDRTRREIKRRFRIFLESDEIHMKNIRSMCANNLVCCPMLSYL